MSSSDDDVPLAGRMNGAKSDSRVPARDLAKDTSAKKSAPGITIRNGPATEMDIDSKPTVNGAHGVNGKRKASLGGRYKIDSSSEDDIPLKKRKRLSQPMPIKSTAAAVTGDSSNDDVPLNKLTKEKAKIEKKAEKQAKALRVEASKAGLKKEVDSDDEKPLSSKKSSIKKSANKTNTPVKKVKREESDNTPLRKQALSKASGAKSIKGKAKPAKREMTEEEEEVDEEEEYRWWEAPMQGDGTKKWTTLEHNGVVFPPPYEPLPKHVKLKYDGVPVSLHPDAEEIASFYGGMLHSTVNVENPTFNKNFFEDFTSVLDKTGHGKDKDGNSVKIKRFEKCDFKPIYEWFESEREKKKSLPAAEKKQLKAEKDEAEKPYMYCKWDGRTQKVGNFRVEPPALFRGRGEHPKTGRVKKRVLPEQITINIGREAKIPAPPAGHKWKEVKHDQEGTWLAMWQENINGAYKYVMLAANSDIKGQSDYKKFEKARELKRYIDRIRRDYNKDLKSQMMADRQMATAVYLIDQFALRAGNEKGEDEADTVGCCSLKYEHVTLRPPNTVIFDFLGKDSIRFYDEVEVDPQVFKNLKLFKKDPKGPGDEIFDRLTTSNLNKHLSGYMAGLTAKVFRTYNASWTMSNELKGMKASGTIPEKVKDYNDANRKVAILCNHKRTVTANHAGQMEKLENKIKGMRYQQWRLKQMMLDLDPKLKKKRGAEFFQRDEDLTQEWLKEHQAALVAEQREKIEKKFKKDNEKRVADGEKEMKAKELQERLETVKELEQKYKKENKSGKVEVEGRGASIEKLEQQIDKLSERVETAKLQAADKEDNKEVALGTSKINYIDPRLTVVFCKKFDCPIERFFSKTLREKFDWAIKSVDQNWEF